MDNATSASDFFTCAKPACGNRTTLEESLYIDGCGQICSACARPLLVWSLDIEPPF